MTTAWIIWIVIMLSSPLLVRFLIIGTVIDYKLRTIVVKKIKEGQTFKEWFLYTRFRKYIPPIMMVWYFANFIYCIVIAIIFTVWVLISGDNEVILKYSKICTAISCLPICCFYLYIGNGFRGISNLVDRDKRYYKKKKKHPLQKKK